MIITLMIFTLLEIFFVFLILFFHLNNELAAIKNHENITKLGKIKKTMSSNNNSDVVTV